MKIEMKMVLKVEMKIETKMDIKTQIWSPAVETKAYSQSQVLSKRELKSNIPEFCMHA